MYTARYADLRAYIAEVGIRVVPRLFSSLFGDEFFVFRFLSCFIVYKFLYDSKILIYTLLLLYFKGIVLTKFSI